MGGEGHPLGIVQEVWIRTNSICTTQNPSEKMRGTKFLGFWDTNGSLNLGQMTRPSDSQQKKWTNRIVDCNVPTNREVKLKENEKSDKYLDLARELEKLWKLKVTMIPIVIGALTTVTKGLVQRLEDLKIRGLEETIQ